MRNSYYLSALPSNYLYGGSSIVRIDNKEVFSEIQKHPISKYELVVKFQEGTEYTQGDVLRHLNILFSKWQTQKRIKVVNSRIATEEDIKRYSFVDLAHNKDVIRIYGVA